MNPCDKLKNRLHEVITDSAALAKHLGCTVQAVYQWKNGVTYPKTESIAKIADFYEVSVDYLFGITNTPNRSAELQTICDYTGLSEQAIFTLVVAKENGLSSLFDRAIENTKEMICEIKGGA